MGELDMVEEEVEIPEEEEDDELAAALAAASPPADDEDGLLGELAGSPPAESPPPEEEEEDEGLEELFAEEDVAEDMKDSVAGSLRLKRVLTQELEEGPDAKKQKLSPEQEARSQKSKQVLAKWRIPGDAVCKHVLDHLEPDEFELMAKAPWSPNPAIHRTPCEQLQKYLCETVTCKLKGIPAGSAIDIISCFRLRFKLDMAADKALRVLSHKDLRLIMENFESSQKLDEAIQEAKETEVETDNDATDAAIPANPGPLTVSRFNRLELIDPLADAAVFGDANLTFALRLAQHRHALGHVGRVCATTFEDLPTLRERYKEIDQSIAVLSDKYFAEVFHCVDCTRIAVDKRFEGLAGNLGAAYYNFPHSGAVQGFFDSHPVVNWRHENLMRLFFRALRSFMKPGGIVKVSSNMGAIGVHYTYIVGGALENEFIHFETMPFLEWHLHRYGRSYGDRRDVYKRPDAKNNSSYNAQDGSRDMVYCFCFKPSGKTMGRQIVRYPPGLQALMGCVDGPFKNLQGPGRLNLAKQLHKRFVTEIGGTHVG